MRKQLVPGSAPRPTTANADALRRAAEEEVPAGVLPREAVLA